jgi:TolB protein
MRPIASQYRAFSRRLQYVAASIGGLALTLSAVVLFAQPPKPGGNPQTIIIPPGLAGTTLAVPDCVPHPGDDMARSACQTITDVLRADLRFEDIRLIADSYYSQLPPFNPDALRFDDWKGAHAELLVVTSAETVKGEVVMNLRIYSVPTGRSILAKHFNNAPNKTRGLAHQATNEVMILAQMKSVALSKIAFVSDRDSVAPKTKTAPGQLMKEIYIADYDGFNPQRLTFDRSLNLVPSWNPDGKSLGYISYKSGLPQLLFAWVYEGRSSGFPAGAGANLMSLDFSPDGTRIAYSSNKSGNPDIWVANVDGTDARHLTNSPAIDTAPSWSPSGNEIAFTSGRSGTPQIWVMDSDGLNPRRVSTVGSYNDGAAWNPAKEFSTEIAYTTIVDRSIFEIVVVDVATGQTRQLTEGRGSCEYPAWSQNGRHLLFACDRDGRWQLTTCDRNGGNIKTIDVGPGNNSQADWGQ